MNIYKTFDAYISRGNGYGQYYLILEIIKNGRIVRTHKLESNDSILWDEFNDVDFNSTEHRRIIRSIRKKILSTIH